MGLWLVSGSGLRNLQLGVLITGALLSTGQEWNKGQNIWVELAKQLDLQGFCLQGGLTSQDLFTSCLWGIPASLQTLLDNHQVNYDSLNDWRKLICEQTREMLRICVVNTTKAEACVEFQGPSGLGGPDVSNTDLHCETKMSGGTILCHMLMPKG